MLERWNLAMCVQVDRRVEFQRNPIANKWSANYRSLVLREAIFWRTNDLLAQAHSLYEAKQILGSRILIRSSLETIAILIHLNQLIEKVNQGDLEFHLFDEKTRKLMLGSRDGSTKHESLNIVTVLQHCEKKYPGLLGIYTTLCESAHPNFEGLCFGYSDVDHVSDQTNFSNKWWEMWADRHESLVKLVGAVFENEYYEVWPLQAKNLEDWLIENNEALEAAKSLGG